MNRSERRRSLGELKAGIRIPQVLDALGRSGSFRRVGQRWVGPCPVHGGDNPRAFTVDLDRDLWYCWTRCREGGDVIDLVRRLQGGWPATFRFLERFEVATVPAIRPAPASPAGPPPPSPGFRPFTRQLPLDPDHAFFHRMDLWPVTLRTFESGGWHGGGLLENTVAVRLFDLDGSPIGYAGRRLMASEIEARGKWVWPARCPKGRLLYGWHRVRLDRTQGLVVVESPWSVMKLHQAGVTHAVALCGTVITPDHRQLLRQAPRVLLFLDGDPAGRLATRRAIEEAIHPRIVPVHGPSGNDPADLPIPVLRTLLGLA